MGWGQVIASFPNQAAGLAHDCTISESQSDQQFPISVKADLSPALDEGPASETNLTSTHHESTSLAPVIQVLIVELPHVIACQP